MSEGGLIPPVVLELRAKAGELYSELGKVKTEVAETAEKTEAAGGKMSKGFQTAAGAGKAITLGLAGAAVAVGGFAIEAATSAQVVDAKLSTAIKNAGGNMEELEPKIGAVDSRLRTFGFTNDQTNTALASLTTALKDPEKAMGAMSVAADLAKAKNIDLNTAAMLVAKGMEGQTRPLKQLGIDLPTYTGGAQNAKVAQDSLASAQLNLNHVLEKYPDAANKGSKAHQQYETAALAVKQAQDKVNETANAGTTIMQAIEGRVKGAASAYGDTLQGKVASAKAGLEAMAESLGKKLIPVITSAIGAAQKFVGWLTDHTPVLYTLAAVIGTVVVTAIGAYIASLAKGTAETIAKLALMVAGWLGYSAESSAAAAEGAAASEASILGQFASMVGAAASGFASMIASSAGWIATQATQLAESAAGFVAWAAEHAVMAAAFIAENVAMAAAATAAFIAENAATLGIVAAIGLIVAGIVWLATHWSEAWDAIKTAAKWAYDNVIKPVGDWIMNNVLRPIGSVVSDLGDIWGRIWGGIKTVIKDVGKVIGDILGGIVGGIQTVVGWIQKAIGWFTSLFDSANNANRAAQAAQQATAAAKVANINFSNSLIGSNLSQYAGGPSKDVGGWIYEAAKGQPIRMTGHGGEYVLSLDMLAGRQRIDPQVAAAVAASAQGPSMSQQALTGATPAGVGAGANVTVIAQTNASAAAIASQVGWTLRGMA